MADRILICAAVLFASYVVATALVFPARAAARFWGILDFPSRRKVHVAPVPLFGGIAIFGALVTVVSCSLILLPFIQATGVGVKFHSGLSVLSNYVLIRPKLWALFAGSLLVTAIGVVDDVRKSGLSPWIKLAAQMAAASFLLIAGITMDLASAYPVIGAIVSIVWVVGITNAFNLLDNMNGLSSGTALICSSVFLVLVMFRGEFFIALLLSAILGSTLGFFQFNIGGGSIFMGDAGSLLLGYLLGALTLMARYVDSESSFLLPVLAPLMILALPIFDTLSVIVIRLHEHRPVFEGDKMHLSHRLVRMGMSPRKTVGFHYLMAFTFAVNALLMMNSRILHSLVALFQVAALAAMVSILMTTRAHHGSEVEREPAPPGNSGQLGGEGNAPIRTFASME
jgi:UDP-GlcNAc:undecaprenyl-phosphate/decaprenyl-phosphate GlcNAc-1-phosphate transferase